MSFISYWSIVYITKHMNKPSVAYLLTKHIHDWYHTWMSSLNYYSSCELNYHANSFSLFWILSRFSTQTRIWFLPINYLYIFTMRYPRTYIQLMIDIENRKYKNTINNFIFEIPGHMMSWYNQIFSYRLYSKKRINKLQTNADPMMFCINILASIVLFIF